MLLSRLDELINMRHPLVRLTGLIDWAEIERTFGATSDQDAGDQHCHLDWWPDCCTCSTTSTLPTKLQSTLGARVNVSSVF